MPDRLFIITACGTRSFSAGSSVRTRTACACIYSAVLLKRKAITVGGHVAAGEEPLAAVLRETSEEIGLRLDPGKLICLDYVKEAVEHDREIAYLYIYAEKDPPFRPGKEVIYMVSADIDDFYDLMTGEKEEITVIPAIKTGPMHDEAFTVKMDNCCFHRNFLDVIYPYIKGNTEKLSEWTAERAETAGKSEETEEK